MEEANLAISPSILLVMKSILLSFLKNQAVTVFLKPRF